MAFVVSYSIVIINVLDQLLFNLMRVFAPAVPMLLSSSFTDHLLGSFGLFSSMPFEFLDTKARTGITRVCLLQILTPKVQCACFTLHTRGTMLMLQFHQAGKILLRDLLQNVGIVDFS